MFKDINKEDLIITISADKDARTLTITDHGIGMSEEELEESINKAAGQVRNVTRYFIGTMLSLLKYS